MNSWLTTNLQNFPNNSIVQFSSTRIRYVSTNQPNSIIFNTFSHILLIFFTYVILNSAVRIKTTNLPNSRAKSPTQNKPTLEIVNYNFHSDSVSNIFLKQPPEFKTQKEKLKELKDYKCVWMRLERENRKRGERKRSKNMNLNDTIKLQGRRRERREKRK